MFSLTPSRFSTSVAPRVFMWVTTDCTRVSGAEAPAVMPIVVFLFSQLCSIWLALSIKYDSMPLRSPNSRSLLEFELLGEPTTNNKSQCCVNCLTASWRFWVA